jgi:hypothetical protein
MVDLNDIIRISIISLLFIAFVFSIVAVYQLPKKQQQCGSNPTASAGNEILNAYYYLFTSSELTLLSLESAFSVLSIFLCFLVYLNNFKVTSIILAVPLIVIASLILANAVSLANDPNPLIKSQYDIKQGVTVPLLYTAMSISIIAGVLILYYYGQNFIKDIRHIV